VHLLKYAFR